MDTSLANMLLSISDSSVRPCILMALRSHLKVSELHLQVVKEGGAAALIALLKAGPNHPLTPHVARALQALACRHPDAQVLIYSKATL